MIEIKTVIDIFNTILCDFKKFKNVIPFISFPFRENLNTQMTPKKGGYMFDIDEVPLEDLMRLLDQKLWSQSHKLVC